MWPWSRPAQRQETHGVCLGALGMDFKTRGVHQGVPLQVANSHMGVRIKHKVDCELPVLQKKIPKQHTAHNITWSLVDRSQER